jgi:hypothetical protein
MKSVREQKQTSEQEALISKERELDQMTNQYNQLEKAMENSAADAEALKIAYEKMIAVKDKEIKEVEERLEEMATSKVNKIK